MNFLQKIKSGAGKVTDRAQSAVEIGRLNTQITNIEREMELYYQKLGEVFYEGYRLKNMSKAETEMIELAKTCDLLSEERDEIRTQIAELKNERLCYHCSKIVAEDAMFCQYCGEKLLKPKPKVNVVDKVVATETAYEEQSSGLSPVLEEDSSFNNSFDPESMHDTVIIENPKVLVDEEAETRRKQELDRERERQEELDRRIRTWKENVTTNESQPNRVEMSIPTVTCQICSTGLVKGTKWCPHCGNEQI